MLPSNENKPWQPNSRLDWIEQRSDKLTRPFLIAIVASQKEGEEHLRELITRQVWPFSSWSSCKPWQAARLLLIRIVEGSTATTNNKRRQRIIKCHGNVIFGPFVRTIWTSGTNCQILFAFDNENHPSIVYGIESLLGLETNMMHVIVSSRWKHTSWHILDIGYIVLVLSSKQCDVWYCKKDLKIRTLVKETYF